MRLGTTKHIGVVDWRTKRVLVNLHILFMVITLLFFSYPKLAIAAEDCNLDLINKNAAFYDPCDVPSNDSCSTTNISGSSNEEKVWNFLAGKQLKPVAIAGIMGNFFQENSYFDPARKQSDTMRAIPDKGDDKTGYGIAQWTSAGRQELLFTQIRNANLQQYYGAGWGSAEKDKDIPVADMDKLLSVELEFAWSGDTTKIKDIATQLNAAVSVKGNDGSAVLFHKLYERSGDDASQIQERVKSAGDMLDKYAGTGTLSSGSCSTGQLGGVNKMDDALPWAMKFIEDTKIEYKGAPKATATLLKNQSNNGKILSIATFPEAGSEFPCWGAFGCDECTTLSGWFVTKMTGYTYGGGNGGDVVDNLKTKGVPMGYTPKPFSIFSYDTGKFGHTGLVLGVEGDGTVITLENNWPTNTLSVRKYNIKGDYPNVKFAYVNNKLKPDVAALIK